MIVVVKTTTAGTTTRVVMTTIDVVIATKVVMTVVVVTVIDATGIISIMVMGNAAMMIDVITISARGCQIFRREQMIPAAIVINPLLPLPVRC